MARLALDYIRVIVRGGIPGGRIVATGARASIVIFWCIGFQVAGFTI